MTQGRTNIIIAVVILIIMFGVYLMTAAPTISFWDCGEFVTCAYIMGIPHPPGSPLLSLVGRVMSIMPFSDYRDLNIDHFYSPVAYRVTMIDVILAALTVMLTYLIMVKLIHRFRPYRGSRLEESIVMFSAAVTAFLVGFSDEFWTNAVEIETYMPSLFLSMMAVWFVLHWTERKDNPGTVRYLFLAAYLIGLGNGVHPTVLLIAPTAFALVVFARPDWFLDVRLLVWSGVMVVAFGLIKMFGGLELLYAVMALFAFVVPVMLYKMSGRRREVWQMTLLGLVLCGSLYIIGYSVYPTIAVRAAKDPVINEGDPDTWERYTLYMSRDQYGQENMYAGMFTRKARFGYQFGYMYLRYLMQQFPKWGPTTTVAFHNDRTPENRSGGSVQVSHPVPLSVLLISLLLYGLYVHGREDWRRLLPLGMFFVASSIGLVLYLNMENPQVRERGYFFLGSYYIIMYWIGLGVYGIMADTLEWLRQKKMGTAGTVVMGALFVVFGTLPPSAVLSNHIDPGYTNWEVHDRTGDWAPRDYGWNILNSCEPNAILFTNGDNDTFPLWYLQEVENFRKDVRVVNLSLLNTPWYIIQLKNQGMDVPVQGVYPGDPESLAPRSAGGAVETDNIMKTVPIRYDDEYIRNVLCGRDDAAMKKKLFPAKGKEMTAAGITWHMSPHQVFNEELGVLRVQDIMVTNIIHWVNWSRPIYFAVTVAENNKINLNDYLSMEGMVYRLVRNKVPEGSIHVNVPVLDRNIFDIYKYHSLADPEVYKPPNTTKLVTNYFIGFAQLAERYAAMGKIDDAVRAAWGAIDNTPHNLMKRNLLYQVFFAKGYYDEGREFLEWEFETGNVYNDPDATRADRMRFASYLILAGMNDEADSFLEEEIGRENLETYEERYNFGSLLLKYSLNDYAYDYFQEMLDDYPGNQQVVEALIAIDYTLGRYEKALELVDGILERTPDNEAVKKMRPLLEKLIQDKKSDSSGAAEPAVP